MRLPFTPSFFCVARPIDRKRDFLKDRSHPRQKGFHFFSASGLVNETSGAAAAAAATAQLLKIKGIVWKLLSWNSSLILSSASGSEEPLFVRLHPSYGRTERQSPLFPPHSLTHTSVSFTSDLCLGFRLLLLLNTVYKGGGGE